MQYPHVVKKGKALSPAQEDYSKTPVLNWHCLIMPAAILQVEQEEAEDKDDDKNDHFKEGPANGPAGKGGGRESEAQPGAASGNLTEKETRATGLFYLPQPKSSSNGFQACGEMTFKLNNIGIVFYNATFPTKAGLGTPLEAVCRFQTHFNRQQLWE